MQRPSVLALLTLALTISSVRGAEQVYLSGPTVRTSSSVPVGISSASYGALLASLIGQRPHQSVNSQTSAEIDQVLLPSVSLRPASLLSLHISGIQSVDQLFSGQQGHQITVSGFDKLKGNPLASVLSRGLSAGSLEHSPLGTSFSCSNACLEQLLKEALVPLEGNYTAAELPFKGTVALPSSSGSQPVEMNLRQTAAQAWATELALIHASSMNLQAQAANRQQAGSSQQKPLVLEGTLQSPRLLAAAHGSGAQEATSAVSALGSTIQQLQQQLSSAYDDRVAVHVTTSNKPLKRADVKAALGTKDVQGRRHLLSSVAASKKPAARDGLGFMAGAMAWISAILILVFGLASCKVLASMQFKQDSLLYGRTKTD